MRSDWAALRAAAPTLGLHYYLSDYYRFSEHAVRDIFFAGMIKVRFEKLLQPPRFIGFGRMP